MVKYYLYHIKGVKWGMTKRTVKRRVWEQGYTLNDVCEIIEISDIDTASNMEDTLNIRHGYKRDPNKYNERDYSAIAKLSPLTNKQRSKGGKTSGANKVNSGLWDIISKNGRKIGYKNSTEKLKICNEKQKKPVLQYDLSGNLIAEYASRNEANRIIGTQIHHALKDSNKTCAGYIWKYKSTTQSPH